MLRKCITTYKVSQTQHFIVSKITLLTCNRYMFRPVTRSPSGDTNTTYVKKGNIKMKDASLLHEK